MFEAPALVTLVVSGMCLMTSVILKRRSQKPMLSTVAMGRERMASTLEILGVALALVSAIFFFLHFSGAGWFFALMLVLVMLGGIAIGVSILLRLVARWPSLFLNDWRDGARTIARKLAAYSRRNL